MLLMLLYYRKVWREVEVEDVEAEVRSQLSSVLKRLRVREDIIKNYFLFFFIFLGGGLIEPEAMDTNQSTLYQNKSYF